LLRVGGKKRRREGSRKGARRSSAHERLFLSSLEEKVSKLLRDETIRKTVCGIIASYLR